MQTVYQGKKIWTLVVFLLLSNLSFANNERQLDINWVTALNLSEAQQQQIHQAEQKYRESMQKLNQGHCSPRELTEKNQALQHQLRQNLQIILSDEQKQLASQIIHDRHQTMQLQQVREITRVLKLSPEQSQELILAVNDLHIDYQWPLDLDQRDNAKALFEQQLQNYLSTEQWQQWQANLQKHQGRWHDSAEFDKKCPHAKHSRQSS